MPKFIDLTGQKFGRWTVIERGSDYRCGHPQWICKCSCGNIGLVRGSILRNGGSKSCGCYNIEVRRAVCIKRNKTHGMTGTRAHRIWISVLTRCLYKSSTSHKNYGGKGISVCAQWMNFENFLSDMGEPPTEKHTLDRINPRGNYNKSNCRWATMQEQQNNRTNNRLISYNGKTQTLQEWSRETGINRKTISRRIDSGWSIHKALTKIPN